MSKLFCRLFDKILFWMLGDIEVYLEWILTEGR